MLRVTTLHASSAAATAAYYTHYLAQAPGEEPGVWSGRQGAGLGLAGRVDADGLRALLEGRDPTSGTPLGNVLRDRTLASGNVPQRGQSTEVRVVVCRRCRLVPGSEPLGLLVPRVRKGLPVITRHGADNVPAVRTGLWRSDADL
jgi:hypothetical protein